MNAPIHYHLAFEQGSLLAWAEPPQDAPPGEGWVYDARVQKWRNHAIAWRETFAELWRAQQRGEIVLHDAAKAYDNLPLKLRGERTPRDYQLEAVQAFMATGRGQIILPTGAGKSFVAHLLMARIQRPTIIVAPTLDLVNQWYSGLLSAFNLDEVGIIGGGYHEPKAVTVTTYDSAWIHAPRYGDRFGFVIFDECHHLPGPTYQQAAKAMIAPFRLGLSATPEREDGSELVNDEIIGPIVYRRGIRDLAGDFLASYDVEEIRVTFTEQERERYDAARERYLSFIRANRIAMGSPSGWGRFIQLSSRTAEGRKAMRAYREQRALALSPEQKLEVVARLLEQHYDDRIIIFTNDNDTVYELSRRFLLPSITHKTPTKERKRVLDNFRNGTWPVVVTSKVLNEGVDVPEARVAIVLSGSGTVREHVQRLGRILRHEEGKRAILYELITDSTVEESVSERRREHDAYR